MDMIGIKCLNHPCQGLFKERSVYDDWEGLLHCSKCNHEVKRHMEIKAEGTMKKRKSKETSFVDTLPGREFFINDVKFSIEKEYKGKAYFASESLTELEITIFLQSIGLIKSETKIGWA